eukprot:15126_1
MSATTRTERQEDENPNQTLSDFYALLTSKGDEISRQRERTNDNEKQFLRTKLVYDQHTRELEESLDTMRGKFQSEHDYSSNLRKVVMDSKNEVVVLRKQLQSMVIRAQEVDVQHKQNLVRILSSHESDLASVREKSTARARRKLCDGEA